jgi:predicted O-linked N-acetylglucosamine transferase (SPINDLY family)
LDLPNFSGYTTAWLAVHSGLPIVTLQGDFLRQRLAAGILRQIGKEENIALTRQSFVANACMLARESYDIEVKCRRRSELKAAAMTCDNRVDVVRALETILLNEVGIHRVVNSVK